MRYENNKYWAQHEVNKPRGSGSVNNSLTSNGQTRVRIREGHIFDITHFTIFLLKLFFYYYTIYFLFVNFIYCNRREYSNKLKYEYCNKLRDVGWSLFIACSLRDLFYFLEYLVRE